MPLKMICSTYALVKNKFKHLITKETKQNRTKKKIIINCQRFSYELPLKKCIAIRQF